MIEDNSPRLLAETLMEMASRLNDFRNNYDTEKYLRDDAEDKLKKQEFENKRLQEKIEKYGQAYKAMHSLLYDMSIKYKGKFLDRIKSTLNSNK
jgi:hypothetical protein